MTWEAFGAWLSIVATIGGSTYVIGTGLGALKVSVDSLLKGEAPRCVEHTAQLNHLREQVSEHSRLLAKQDDDLRKIERAVDL